MAAAGISPNLLPSGTLRRLLAICVWRLQRTDGDGDTIRVGQDSQSLTVRLACIDALETAQRPHGQQARGYLQKRLSIGREVKLEVKTTDRYGCSVAEVFSEVNINLALV